MRYRLLLSVVLVGMCVFAVAQAQDATPPVFDEASVNSIVLDDVPILPVVTNAAQKIYALGQQTGHNSHIFSKVGDCMTASPNFLVPFGTGDYDLGQYADLQPIIDYFSAVPARGEGYTANALSNPGLATTVGFTTVSVLDPIWADPQWCTANESSLACEYRVSQPAFALIMFGTNDTNFFDAATFNQYLRQIIDQTIQDNIVPVLYTFPERPEFPDKSILFNQIIVQIARDYDLPLINLYRALESLPDKGVNLQDPIHLSSPLDGMSAGNFTPANLQRGYPFRNLITLQALDILYHGLIQGEATPEPAG